MAKASAVCETFAIFFMIGHRADVPQPASLGAGLTSPIVNAALYSSYSQAIMLQLICQN